MRTKCLPLYIPSDLYKRLEERATAEERDPLQQARWLLKQALSEDTDRSALTTNSRGTEAVA